ncbi:ABC transporter permease [Bacillus sp. FJAT-29790]|uniref:ABC transporter permease n=1 Tax=Bacillus sp. FJAT-29790 TaxID=1895002 RepID=UPI001C2441CC|nr:ABC transporter permease [Bacillus sp. FJAT-29790]MBU8878510.1 ABC transporter permease [Bacillus sp. FJAT-29790]
MRSIAIMIRIILQFKHDKRTIALMIFAPIFVLTFMSFIFSDVEYHPKIGIINAPTSFVNKLEENDAKVMRYDESNAHEALRLSEVDAMINFKSGVPEVQLEGSDPAKSKVVLMLIQKVNQPAIPAAQPDITYFYGYEDMTSFDNFGPVLIGLFVFFFVFLISSVAFLSERTSGTLERLLTTPIRRWEIVVGYVLGFGFFTIIQSALVAWYTIHVLDIIMVGSFGFVLLITILTAMVALSIGILISTFANNELQVIQFIQVILVPQVFFSGLFDISTMPTWLQLVGRIMPLSYVVDALRSIMIRGKGWEYIAIDVYILMALFLFFMVVNIFALKKYRKI